MFDHNLGIGGPGITGADDKSSEPSIGTLLGVEHNSTPSVGAPLELMLFLAQKILFTSIIVVLDQVDVGLRFTGTGF